MSRPTRREFLSSAAAAATAAAALPNASRALAAPAWTARKKKLLVLGGTSYLGPAVVRAALAEGHEVTLFNRGRTNPQLFPECEKLQGQRRRPTHGGRGEAQDLSALKGRTWDGVVDTSEYFPQNVEDMAAALKDGVGHYVFVSTLSVYADCEVNANDLDEDKSPLGTLEDPNTPKLDEKSYGPLKAYCEQAVAMAFGQRCALVRPGYIIGPEDPFDRLTSRVLRLAKGGDTLAPGTPSAELQMVDVRDLGAFLCKAAVEAIPGRFNATGFEAHVSALEFHHACKLMFAHDTKLEWVSDDFLLAQKLEPWVDIACWLPDAKRNHAPVERAIAAGLRFRPLCDTIRDTHAWGTKERPADKPWRAGMKAEREAEILRAWRSK